VTTRRAGGVGNVDARRDGRAVPEPNSTTRFGINTTKEGGRKGVPQNGVHTGASGEVDETSFDALGKEEGRREDVIRQEGVCLE
jgi:hypothetical protein